MWSFASGYRGKYRSSTFCLRLCDLPGVSTLQANRRAGLRQTGRNDRCANSQPRRIKHLRSGVFRRRVLTHRATVQLQPPNSLEPDFTKSRLGALLRYPLRRSYTSNIETSRDFAGVSYPKRVRLAFRAVDGGTWILVSLSPHQSTIRSRRSAICGLSMKGSSTGTIRP